MYEKLYSQLSAASTLAATGDGPEINERGTRVLKYLHKRKRREKARWDDRMAYYDEMERRHHDEMIQSLGED